MIAHQNGERELSFLLECFSKRLQTRPFAVRDCTPLVYQHGIDEVVFRFTFYEPAFHDAFVTRGVSAGYL